MAGNILQEIMAMILHWPRNAFQSLGIKRSQAATSIVLQLLWRTKSWFWKWGRPGWVIKKKRRKDTTKQHIQTHTHTHTHTHPKTMMGTKFWGDAEFLSSSCLCAFLTFSIFGLGNKWVAAFFLIVPPPWPLTPLPHTCTNSFVVNSV